MPFYEKVKIRKFVKFKVKHFVEIPTIRHDKAVSLLFIRWRIIKKMFKKVMHKIRKKHWIQYYGKNVFCSREKLMACTAQASGCACGSASIFVHVWPLLELILRVDIVNKVKNVLTLYYKTFKSVPKTSPQKLRQEKEKK